MYQCKKCGSNKIVCNQTKVKFEAGNDFYINEKFGKIITNVEICWCSQCGELYNSKVYIDKQ